MTFRLLFIMLVWVIIGCEKTTEPEEEEEVVVVEEYSIQGEIDKAEDGDTVLVQPGTYEENIDFMGKNIVLGSLFLTTADPYYIGSTRIIGGGTNATVTFQRGEDSTALFTGFTVSHSAISSEGGGILCRNSNPRLENLHLLDNNADHGAGMYLQGDPGPVIKDVVLEDNGGGWGGGMRLYLSTARFENCTITGNSSRHGGVIWVNESNPVFVNVDIIDNSGGDDVGGGIKFMDSGGTLRNVRFIRNSADFGAAIYSTGSDITLENVIFYDNSSADGGSAIYAVGSSNITAKNVVFSSNTAGVNGGAIYSISSSINLVNSILRGDSPEEIYFSPDGDLASIMISYSNIQGGQDGIITNDNVTVEWLDGNLDEDPLFADVENGDFHLQEGSSCINAGNPDTEYNDPDGSRNDMGSYGGPNGNW